MKARTTTTSKKRKITPDLHSTQKQQSAQYPKIKQINSKQNKNKPQRKNVPPQPHFQSHATSSTCTTHNDTLHRPTLHIHHHHTTNNIATETTLHYFPDHHHPTHQPSNHHQLTHHMTIEKGTRVWENKCILRANFSLYIFFLCSFSFTSFLSDHTMIF